MHLMVLGFYLLLFNTVRCEKYVEQGMLDYQESVDIRFQEMNTILRQQALQLKKQSERIQNLETIVATHANANQHLQRNIESLEKELVKQKKHIKNLEITVDDQRNEIKTLKFKQLKSDTDLSSLVLQIGEKVKTTQQKPFSGTNVRTSLPTEVLTEDQQHESVRRSKERRLLIGVTNVPPVVQRTAFYAYLSHHEILLNNHHTIIFDTVKTNLNSAYSGFTGVFTAPVGGVYGFIYTIRMGCHTTNAIGPFEIIKNNDVEGVVIIYDHACQNQVTVTGNVIIHANLGDKIFVRSHTSFPEDGNIYSNTNGRSSFAGWLIQET